MTRHDRRRRRGASPDFDTGGSVLAGSVYEALGSLDRCRRWIGTLARELASLDREIEAIERARGASPGDVSERLESLRVTRTQMATLSDELARTNDQVELKLFLAHPRDLAVEVELDRSGLERAVADLQAALTRHRDRVSELLATTQPRTGADPAATRARIGRRSPSIGWLERLRRLLEGPMTLPRLMSRFVRAVEPLLESCEELGRRCQTWQLSLDHARTLIAERVSTTVSSPPTDVPGPPPAASGATAPEKAQAASGRRAAALEALGAQMAALDALGHSLAQTLAGIRKPIRMARRLCLVAKAWVDMTRLRRETGELESRLAQAEGQLFPGRPPVHGPTARTALADPSRSDEQACLLWEARTSATDLKERLSAIDRRLELLASLSSDAVSALASLDAHPADAGGGSPVASAPDGANSTPRAGPTE